MLKVTDAAKAKLQDMLWGRDRGGAALRLAVDGAGRVALFFDKETGEDQAVSYGRGRMLVIDKSLRAALDGAILDVSGTGEHSSLVMTRRDYTAVKPAAQPTRSRELAAVGSEPLDW